MSKLHTIILIDYKPMVIRQILDNRLNFPYRVKSYIYNEFTEKLMININVFYDTKLDLEHIDRCDILLHNLKLLAKGL